MKQKEMRYTLQINEGYLSQVFIISHFPLEVNDRISYNGSLYVIREIIHVAIGATPGVKFDLLQNSSMLPILIIDKCDLRTL